MNLNNRFSKKVIIIAIISVLLIFSITYFAFALNTDKIYKGISIGKTDVSGLNKEQAIQKVKGELKNIDGIYLTLKSSQTKWQIPYTQLNAKYNVEDAVEKAYTVGRNGSIINKTKDIIGARFGKKFDVIFEYNKQFLIDTLSGIQKSIDIPKKNATIMPGTNGGVIVPHASGKKLDFDKSIEILDQNITKISNDEIELPISEDNPTILDTQLNGMTEELGSFSTTFQPSDLLRVHNIKLACSRIDGKIIKPNELFSMDVTIKNRTENNGYKMAKAYLDDEVVNEIGGGVCQVTTTLYDAVLLSNLEVTERKQHSMMVGYVEPGFDAAISDTGVDFKFKNSLDSPIYLYSSVENNKIIMKVYGKKKDKTQTVKLDTEVYEIYYAQPEQVILDPSLPKGTRKVEVKSKNGYKASLFKSIYRNGVLVSRELVSENSYKPLRGTIKVGG